MSHILRTELNRPRFLKKDRVSAAEYIKDKLMHFTLEAKIQKFKTFSGLPRTKTGENVIGIIPGRNRGKATDRVLVIGAHYDTVKG